jgi:BirA family biotin operon repressor/biotin-[acetyl-CoA-carboxylase] ligase
MVFVLRWLFNYFATKLSNLLAQTENSSLAKWLHCFDTLDSTNNYAMQYIDDGMAQHGDVIWAKHQTAGKGQRGKTWEDNAENLKISLIIHPQIPAEHQFALSMLTAVTIIEFLTETLPSSCSIAVKWPNDIYINDKKACGILIENVFRGMKWAFSVIGIGLNVHQMHFPENLKNATSLKKESGMDFDFYPVIRSLRAGILNALALPFNPEKILETYNAALYKKGKTVLFKDLNTNTSFEAFVTEANLSGALLLLTPTGIRPYTFGTLEWILG